MINADSIKKMKKGVRLVNWRPRRTDVRLLWRRASSKVRWAELVWMYLCRSR